jgi:cell wall-associated NlpC family hydrolase
MRRTRRGSPFRPDVKAARNAVPVSGVAAVLLCLPGVTPGLAVADPAPDTLATLIADVAKANQRLDDLGAQIQTEKESVNKALVDVQNARDNAATAQNDVDTSQQAVNDANVAIDSAQHRFDKFAAATYMNGPSGGYLTAANPDDIIATASAQQTLTASSQRAMTNLQRARTEQINKSSEARLAKQQADQAVTDAQSSQDAAVSKLTETQRTFGQQRQQLEHLAAERDEAQAKLDAARSASDGAATSPEAAPGAQWDRGGQKKPGKWEGEWDPTLPAVPSAFVDGDPVAVINTLLGYSQTSAQVTQDMGRKFMQSLGLMPTPSGETNGGAIPHVYGRQASEYVIRRGMSQIGVPYSWGGGNAAGPSKGIGSGSGIVGFDCSGLVLYSFAGVGIKLPHYSGSQYDMGRKIPSSQMRRGDVIFYGPGGSQHVTIYLGQGKMLEAPDEGQTVKVSPVRTSGMTPHVIRYIEY